MFKYTQVGFPLPGAVTQSLGPGQYHKVCSVAMKVSGIPSPSKSHGVLAGG
jgi:hypothetical protein